MIPPSIFTLYASPVKSYGGDAGVGVGMPGWGVGRGCLGGGGYRRYFELRQRLSNRANYFKLTLPDFAWFNSVVLYIPSAMIQHNRPKIA